MRESLLGFRNRAGKWEYSMYLGLIKKFPTSKSALCAATISPADELTARLLGSLSKPSQNMLDYLNVLGITT